MIENHIFNHHALYTGREKYIYEEKLTVNALYSEKLNVKLYKYRTCNEYIFVQVKDDLSALLILLAIRNRIDP